MLNPTDDNRPELLAALAGAVLGIVGGYLSGNDWFIMTTWAVVRQRGGSGFSSLALMPSSPRRFP